MWSRARVSESSREARDRHSGVLLPRLELLLRGAIASAAARALQGDDLIVAKSIAQSVSTERREDREEPLHGAAALPDVVPLLQQAQRLLLIQRPNVLFRQ